MLCFSVLCKLDFLKPYSQKSTFIINILLVIVVMGLANVYISTGQ